MSLTDAQYQDWLESSDAQFTFLVELSAKIGSTETMIYLSTLPYNTKSTDVPANTVYDPVASIDVLFTEQLTLDNSDSSISAGQLEVENYDGSRDGWFNYIWDNRPIKVYVGDVRWARSDFRLAFNGVVADIAPNGRTALALKLRDKMQQVNTPVTDLKVGGTGQYKDDLIPVSFGENHNVTPILENSATLVYRVHPTSVYDIPEVRDNGVPLTGVSLPVVDKVNGSFQLTAAPAGTITCTVQGDNAAGYNLTCATIVQRILTSYGDVAKRFTAADIDTAQFATFDQTHGQPMGSFCADRTNILDLCRQFTGSIGAQIYVTSQGLVRIFQLTFPPSGGARIVTTSDMDDKTMTPVDRTTAVGAVKLGFCKNWTVQEGLVSGIPQAHKDLYAKEWLTSAKSDATVQSDRKLTGEPTQQDTMLLRRIDADTEAQRQLNMWKVPRMSYEFEGLPGLFTLELGDTITVYHPRYGMSNGVSGTVISIARNWKNRRVKVRFIV